MGKIKNNLPSAQFEGVLKINDTELEVAVLNNGKRIISQSSVFKALGRPSRGVRATIDGEIKLPAFMDAANLLPYLNHDLMEAIKRERFTDNSGATLEGYDASILPLVCDVYLKARQDGALKANQMDTAQKAEILVRSLAKVGIIALVDEATGYQEIRPKDALQAYLDKIISKELAAWAKKFPDEFYENIYKLRNWPWSGMSKTDSVWLPIIPGTLFMNDSVTLSFRNLRKKRQNNPMAIEKIKCINVLLMMLATLCYHSICIL